MQKNIISIIIPCYNAEKYIGKCILKVLELDFNLDHMEIIVIDDGSSDNTYFLAKECLQKSGVKFQLFQQAQGGPSSAQNKGWRAARGNWIQFLDCDDRLTPDKLRLQSDYLEKLSDSVAVVYSPFVRVSNPDRLLFPTLDPNNMGSFIASDGFVQIGAKLYRKKWLELVDGFDESCRVVHDINIDIRIAIKGGQFFPLRTSHPILYYADRNPNSLSCIKKFEFMNDCVGNARLVEDYWKKRFGILTSVQIASIMNVYDFALRYYVRHDKNKFFRLSEHAKIVACNWRPSTGWVANIALIVGYQNALLIINRIKHLLDRFKNEHSVA